MLVCEAGVTFNVVGSVTVAEAVVVQPLASVMVTLYVPAISPFISSVVAVLFHSKLYGAVPPVTVKSTVPLLPPLQLTPVATILADSPAVGCVTVKLCVAVHPLVSVTVQVQVPALSPDTDVVPSPVGFPGVQL